MRTLMGLGVLVLSSCGPSSSFPRDADHVPDGGAGRSDASSDAQRPPDASDGGTSSDAQRPSDAPDSGMSASCPSFTWEAVELLPSYVDDAGFDLAYPEIIDDDGPAFLYRGGFAHTARSQGIDTDVRYPISQEEIYVSRWSLFERWGDPEVAFRILPETPVQGANVDYGTMFPDGFKEGCTALPGGQCNVQINDVSGVTLGGLEIKYFSILENYRWYDGSLGDIVDGNPTNPAEQNRHSIGAAFDFGPLWGFIGKVIPEDPGLDDAGEPVLGAWAPSALLRPDRNVDVYFHDALGTKQYAALLSGGTSLLSIRRLNPGDELYRTNLDVIPDGDGSVLVAYNDSEFNIVLARYRPEAGFECATIVVPASEGQLWPTPDLLRRDDGIHLHFGSIPSEGSIHHWVGTPR